MKIRHRRVILLMLLVLTGSQFLRPVGKVYATTSSQIQTEEQAGEATFSVKN